MAMTTTIRPHTFNFWRLPQPETPTMKAIREIVEKFPQGEETTRFHFSVSEDQVMRAIQSYIVAEYYIEEYVDSNFELGQKHWWLISRRRLTDPGIKKTWIFKKNTEFSEKGVHFTEEILPSIEESNSVQLEPFCTVRFNRYLLKDDIWIDVCAYMESTVYTRYYAVGTSLKDIGPAMSPTASRVMAFISKEHPAFLQSFKEDERALSEAARIYESFPCFFPEDMKDSTPDHWLPFDMPLPEGTNFKQDVFPMEMTQERREQLIQKLELRYNAGDLFIEF